MKLTNEVFTLLFCSGDRPKICLKNTNICCMYCDCKVECNEKNKEIKSTIKPCMFKYDEDDVCAFLV